MRLALLCGGRGLRLNGGTTPKALAEVKGQPLVRHVLDIYRRQLPGIVSHLLLGHLGDAVRLHFLLHPTERVRLEETGKDTGTCGRLLRCKHLSETTLMVAYCDTLANVDLRGLIDFHRAHGKLASLVAVPAVSRFGVLGLGPNNGSDAVHSFHEKPLTRDWVSAGFFIFEPKAWDYFVDGPLEGAPLAALADAGQLMAFRHSGCVYTIDSPKDIEEVEALEGMPWLR